ncbi:MAG TPA: aminotransferase class I/II-fold pyridoxal phosphate-dependent enzyme, partial [Chloroflexota bacterium]
MSPVLRRTAPPVAHGGIDPAEIERLGLRPEDILDFSTNVNPLGPPPGLGEALLEVDPAAYPDRNALALRRALAERLAVTPDDLLVGNGSAEIIWLLALAALAPSDRVVIVGPTFGEYARAARLAGAEVVEYQAREDDAFVPDVAKVVDLVRVARPALLFVCNPNNPTGAYLGRDAVEMLLRAVGEGLLVLDEAYVRFVEDPWSATDLVSRGNLVLLRSMTKD